MQGTMKAALMYGPNDIRVEEVAAPSCPDGGFVVKVRAVGLCGSDIRNLTTDSRKGDYPHIYGHEVVGEVAEVAPGVTAYRPGQQIYVYPAAHCLRCENCRMAHHEQCTDLDDYLNRPGGFAEYIAYPASRVARGATFELAEGQDPVLASLAEPMSSTYACVDNIDVTLGDTVVVIGAGPIGVFLSILSRMRGAATIIVIDINDERLAKVSAFGVDHTINSTTHDPVEEVMRLTRGLGAHKVISANPSTQAQAQAIRMARACGTVVFFGGVPAGALAEIDSNLVHYRGLWIYGHYGANSIQVQRAFELAVSPGFPGAQIVTNILPLEQINEAIELTRTGAALKVVLRPDLNEEEIA
ncbi:MAG: alcohol dehydrogenase catalytic domain-containing protein [Propioniciclava sp.]